MYLQRAAQAGRHAHLMALFILSVGSVLLSSTQPGTQDYISGKLSVRVAENPGYTGQVILSQEANRSLNALPRS
jgi:hypothetical protein